MFHISFAIFLWVWILYPLFSLDFQFFFVQLFVPNVFVPIESFIPKERNGEIVYNVLQNKIIHHVSNYLNRMKTTGEREKCVAHMLLSRSSCCVSFACEQKRDSKLKRTPNGWWKILFVFMCDCVCVCLLCESVDWGRVTRTWNSMHSLYFGVPFTGVTRLISIHENMYKYFFFVLSFFSK